MIHTYENQLLDLLCFLGAKIIFTAAKGGPHES